MEWMARGVERRADPREFLPGARSVVVVALNYFTPHEHTDDPRAGKISRYAWGDDYHDVLGEKLRALLDFIKELVPGARARTAVDGKPPRDKPWAAGPGRAWTARPRNPTT